MFNPNVKHKVLDVLPITVNYNRVNDIDIEYVAPNACVQNGSNDRTAKNKIKMPITHSSVTTPNKPLPVKYWEVNQIANSSWDYRRYYINNQSSIESPTSYITVSDDNTFNRLYPLSPSIVDKKEYFPTDIYRLNLDKHDIYHNVFTQTRHRASDSHIKRNNVTGSENHNGLLIVAARTMSMHDYVLENLQRLHDTYVIDKKACNRPDYVLDIDHNIKAGKEKHARNPLIRSMLVDFLTNQYVEEWMRSAYMDDKGESLYTNRYDIEFYKHVKNTTREIVSNNKLVEDVNGQIPSNYIHAIRRQEEYIDSNIQIDSDIKYRKAIANYIVKVRNSSIYNGYNNITEETDINVLRGLWTANIAKIGHPFPETPDEAQRIIYKNEAVVQDTEFTVDVINLKYMFFIPSAMYKGLERFTVRYFDLDVNLDANDDDDISDEIRSGIDTVNYIKQDINIDGQSVPVQYYSNIPGAKIYQRLGNIVHEIKAIPTDYDVGAGQIVIHYNGFENRPEYTTNAEHILNSLISNQFITLDISNEEDTKKLVDFNLYLTASEANRYNYKERVEELKQVSSLKSIDADESKREHEAFKLKLDIMDSQDKRNHEKQMRESDIQQANLKMNHDKNTMTWKTITGILSNKVVGSILLTALGAVITGISAYFSSRNTVAA